MYRSYVFPAIELTLVAVLALQCLGCVLQHYSCRFVLCNRSPGEVTATLIGESHKGHSRVIPAGQCEGVGMFRSAGEKGTIEISSLNGEIQSISVVAGKGSHDEVTVDFPSPSWSKAAQHK